MNHFNREHLAFDDADAHAAVWQPNPDYDADDLPTINQWSITEAFDALNADAYAAQLDAMVHEAEPMIEALASTAAMLIGSTGELLPHVANAESEAGREIMKSALEFGQQARDIYDSTRCGIERDAGIED